jgi:hypothetical protein
MDPTSNSTVPNPPPPPTKIKFPISLNNAQMATISVAIFIILALGLVVFFFYQNQKLKQILSTYALPSPTPVAAYSPLTNWVTYKSSQDYYEIKVPKEWIQSPLPTGVKRTVIFQSPDGLYRITVAGQDNKNKVTGKPYPSLDEFIGLPYTVKSYTVDGQEARQPLPRAGSENYDKVYFFSKDTASLLSIEMLVGDGTLKDHRVTGDTLEIGSHIFDQVVSTFKFADIPTPTPTDGVLNSSPSAEPIACTMDAKVCPNGSSVGRVPPSCNFAPCPAN